MTQFSPSMTFREVIEKSGLHETYNNLRLCAPLNAILLKPESFPQALEILRDPDTQPRTIRQISRLFTARVDAKNIVFQEMVARNLEYIEGLFDLIFDPEVRMLGKGAAVQILSTLFLSHQFLLETVRDSDFYVRLLKIYDVSPSLYADILHSRFLLMPFEDLYFLWGCLLSLNRNNVIMENTHVPACWAKQLDPEPGCIAKLREADIRPAAFAMILEILRKEDDGSSATEIPPVIDTEFLYILETLTASVFVGYSKLFDIMERGGPSEEDCFTTLRALCSCGKSSQIRNSVRRIVEHSPFVGSQLNHMCIRYLSKQIEAETFDEYFELAVELVVGQYYIDAECQEYYGSIVREGGDPQLVWFCGHALPNQMGRNEVLEFVRAVLALESPKVAEFRVVLQKLIVTCWGFGGNTREVKASLATLGHVVGKSESDEVYNAWYDEVVMPFVEGQGFKREFSLESSALVDGDFFREIFLGYAGGLIDLLNPPQEEEDIE